MPMPVPREVRPDLATRTLHLVWSDGATSAIPFDTLRDNCPCARCRPAREAGRKPLKMVLTTKLLDWKRLGNYALHFSWGDSHSDGIFSYTLLRELAAPDATKRPD